MGSLFFLNIYDSVKVIRPPVSRFYYNYFSKTYPTNKGQINLVFSIPLVNSFYFQPQLENKKINTGFGGISSSVEYYYKNNKFFGLSGNAVVDYFVPFPVGVDISGGYETMNSVYLSITDNFKFKRFSVGYGLNYSKNNWAYKFSNRFNPPPPTRTPESKSSQSFGFTFNVYHQFSKNFFVGLIYRPSFIKIYPTTELKYEHLLSLDFTWKIRLKN